MKLQVNLMFQGRCEAAFRLYQSVFGGELETLRYEGSPIEDQVPADWGDKLAHATLTFGTQSLSGADIATEAPVKPPAFYLLVSTESAAETRRVADQLSVGGEVIMPVQQTFFSSAYGIVVDRFGVGWKLSCSSVP
ncbi:MAG: VOC family protein [Acidobacteriota bacterium]